MPQLQGIIAAGASVVSTCEELSYPWARHPDLAEALDASARAHDVGVLGTGVNPGFVMDFLPLVLSSVTARVVSVRVVRVVDAAARRGPLQRKIGAGLDTNDFQQRAARGAVGHLGLRESLHLIAAGLQWDLLETSDVLEPVVASEPHETRHVRVAPGTVAGIHQIARGRTAQGRVVELELWMSVGAANPRDEIVVEGDPGVRVVIPGGLFGDSATAAIVANAIPSIQRAPPGLHTMLDMPPLPPSSGPGP
jgi:4-hydroxy-tetrahydrodipicolinate reductase